MKGLKLQVWERQPLETNKSWDAFVMYRDMPADVRGLKSVAEKLEVSVANVGKWSTKFHWTERAAEFDTFIDRETSQKTRLETERQKVEMLSRHTKASVFVQNRIVERLRNMTEKDWAKVPVSQLAQMFLNMAAFERLSRGLPSDSIEIRTAEQIKQQQVTEARLYLDEVKHDFPILSPAEHLSLVCEAFEVTSEDLGYSKKGIDERSNLDGSAEMVM